MTAVALTTNLEPTVAQRAIAHRTRGSSHGPITRLISPGDLGEVTKPFVFLDFFESTGSFGKGFAPHPHSGIATHTTLLRGSTTYGDATGAAGVLPEGGLEWMQAGGGVWHWGNPVPGDRMRGYQLWIALPEALENAPAYSEYVDPAAVPADERVRVLLGSYGGLKSPIRYAEPLTYLHVRLRDGEVWTFTPPAGHDVAWLAVHEGRLATASTVLDREVAVFEDGGAPISVVAQGATEFVIGSSVRHPHPLITGYYSVHTSEEALVRGEAGIERAFNALAREAVVRHRGG